MLGNTDQLVARLIQSAFPGWYISTTWSRGFDGKRTNGIGICNEYYEIHLFPNMYPDSFGYRLYHKRSAERFKTKQSGLKRIKFSQLRRLCIDLDKESVKLYTEEIIKKIAWERSR